MLRVFIGYATRSVVSPPVIDGLEARARAAGLEIDWFQDKRSIRIGEVWERAIDTALHDCHAAVLLLCRDALDSWWVRKEVIVFQHRMVMEPGFLFLPILLDGVVDTDFTDRPDWRPSGAARYQLRKGHAAAELDGTLTEVITELGAHAGAIEPTPVELLRDDLKGVLDGVRNRGRLRTALAKLDGPRTPDGRLSEEVANALLRSSVDTVARALTELAQGDAAVVRELLSAFPFSWVHGDAAVPLVPRVEYPPRPAPPRVLLPGVVVIPTVLQEPGPGRSAVDPRVLPWSWLVRGSCRTQGVDVLTVTGQSHGSMDALIAEVEQALAELPEGAPVTDAKLLARWRQDMGTVIVLPLPSVHIPALSALATRFPLVLFFVLVPPGTPVPDEAPVHTPRPWPPSGAPDAEIFEREVLDTWARLARLAGLPRPYPPPFSLERP